MFDINTYMGNLKSIPKIEFVECNSSNQDLERIYRDQKIQKAIDHDHKSNKGVIDHPLATYWLVKVDDIIVGAYLFVWVSALEFEIHSLLLDSALKHSRTICSTVIGILFNSNPTLQRITAPIISNLQTVVNYCTKIGFTIEGIRRDAVSQNNVLRSIVIMGITRSDFINKVNSKG